MCCTASPARLSNTLIYAGTAHKNGKDIHVLAYQNVADNDAPGPNAMVLPFPSAEPMDEKNILDTRDFKGFLKDITNASKVQTRSLGFSLNGGTKSAKSAKVFDVGSYTIVLAESANQIPEALTRVPENKRPLISDEFLVGYAKMYPDQPIAVCCWDGHLKAEPLLWWYVPRDKDTLFIPTMDAHDGKAPDLNARVDADHIISVGSALEQKVGKHNRVLYRDGLPKEAMGLLPSHVYGMQLDQMVKNGDMFVDANRLGHERDHKSIPKVVRGASFLLSDNEWEMYGWS
jgi:hypothetical protein